MIVKPTWPLIERMASNMRERDTLECMRGWGNTPLKALKLSVELSDYSRALVLDDEPLAMWGMVKGTPTVGDGYPWMLSANGIERHKRLLLRGSKIFLDEMLSICPKLSARVDAEYPEAVRWLKWLGFELRGPEPFGPSGALFYEATKEA
jgi:hypothetical protein